jgi:heterodisulfide reductase subunit A
MEEKPANNNLRVGVFVCDCGLNIAGVVDTAAVTEYAGKLPDVACAIRNKYTCADPGQNEIKDAIRQHDLNRVVVASCTPRQHEPTFRQCVSEAGMNPYLMEMANLREHCSWVHAEDKTRRALVIGGGVTGIEAALQLADAGHKVTLVEKQASIGGIMAQLDKNYPTMDCSI